MVRRNSSAFLWTEQVVIRGQLAMQACCFVVERTTDSHGCSLSHTARGGYERVVGMVQVLDVAPYAAICQSTTLPTTSGCGGESCAVWPDKVIAG